MSASSPASQKGRARERGAAVESRDKEDAEAGAAPPTVSSSSRVADDRGVGRMLGSGWSRTMVKGLRANDLAGKAGEIAGELEERLVRGQYAFGETLSIYTLAKQFDASRQPVAAAVLYLRSVGYLEVIPQVGCRVVSPSPQEVADFYALFSRTEGLICRLAAERHVGHEARDLLATAQELAANPFQSSYDRRAMADGISIFHDQVSAMARSHLLVERISNLRRIFRFYLSHSRVWPDPIAGPPQRMNQLRIDLASAILARRGPEAEQRTESYILGDIDDWARVV
jgi:DNA-binding GntR family transcriptional regulator